MERHSVDRFGLVISALLVAFLLAHTAAAQKCKKYPIKPRKQACLQYKKFSDCPDQGCGSTDEAELNERKNIRSADLTTAVDSDLETLRNKKLPGDGVMGSVVRTAAWMTDIRSGSQESCNCYFSQPINTDNHIVLINDFVINNFQQKDWEKHSFTVEFTPRVKRAGHPHFKCDRIRPLMLKDPRKRLWVRITGTLLFDSYHVSHPLKRETNWEIHPVFRFEYCPWPKQCSLHSDEGWTDIDQ